MIDLDGYRAAFTPTAPKWDQDRPLIQLGMPSPNSIVLWSVPRRGEKTEIVTCIRQHPDARIERTRIDPAGPVRIEIFGLAPNRVYDIDVTLTDRGAEQSFHLPAHTAPDGVPADFGFVVTSCLQPFAGGTRGKSSFITNQTAHVLDLFRKRAHAPPSTAPAFALFLGDQVYVDDGAVQSGARAMLHGWKSQKPQYDERSRDEFFEVLYRAFFSIPPFADALQRLPSAMMWDDHEIRDGWGSQGDEAIETWRGHLATARRYFVAWQALRNPALVPWGQMPDVDAELTRCEELDFTFDWGELATFFVMDQRSHRNSKELRVVSDSQLERLEKWLRAKRDRPTVFVLCSPVPLTLEQSIRDVIQRLFPMRRDDLRDCWWSKACRPQRERLLGILKSRFDAHRHHRLLILSGDVHFSEVLELSDEHGQVFGHEIVSSGLAQTSFFRMFRGGSQKCAQLDHGIFARGLGRFLGPSFAEVFIRSGDRVPNVGVTFHTAVTCDGEVLARSAGESSAPVELRLDTLDPEGFGNGGLFGRFAQPEPARRPAKAAAMEFFDS